MGRPCDMLNQNIVPFSDKSQIQLEASQWVIKLDSGTIAEEEVAELRQWLSQSRAHRTQFRSQVELWGNLDVLEELSEVIQRDGTEEQSETAPVAPRRRQVGYYAVAACLAMVCLSALLFLGIGAPRLSELNPDSQVFATAKGNQQTVTLPDGSVVRLNTDTRLKLDFTEQARRVRLVRGEAHFAVAHNPERPFIVHVADGSVRAVGTAFNVRYQRETVDVIVTEGTVEVASNIVPAIEAIKTDAVDAAVAQQAVKVAVTAGHEVSFDEEAIRAVASVAPASIDRKLAWHNGMLLFDGDPLVDAIAEVSRYTDTKIIIANAELKQLRVGGYFKVGEVEAMFAVFEQTFGIKVTRMGNSLVYLSKQSAHPQG